MSNLSVQEVRALALRLAARQAVDVLQGVRPSCGGVVLMLRDWVLDLADQPPGPEAGPETDSVGETFLSGLRAERARGFPCSGVVDSAWSVQVADWLVASCSGLECCCEVDGDAENGPDPYWRPCWACSLAEALDRDAASLAGSKFTEVI